MPVFDDIAWLGGWEGYRVAGVERVQGRSAEVWITLEARSGVAPVCEGCGGAASGVHEITERHVRDLPILDAATWLVVPRRRVMCPRCGPKLERLSWLGRYSRVTKRLAESAARLCRHVSIKRVAEFFGLHWNTVKAIDKRYLQERLGPVELAGVTMLAMDEFALHKGYRYATVIVDAATKRVLWVGKGRRREDIRPFFELLGEQGRARIKAVAMDMSGPFEAEVLHQCPNAEIVFDLFHVVAKYGREVIDQVRRAEANRLKHDKPAWRLVRGSKWLLLKNPDNLKVPRQRHHLKQLLAANKDLMCVYVLKDDLKQLWHQSHPLRAQTAWRDWFRRAMQSGIKPLIAFAKRLKRYRHGIFAHAKWPLHTSLIEGINNKIKVIKRVAYGFRDDQYFFLKIRDAFPGNA